jgi:hypothetical protein
MNRSHASLPSSEVVVKFTTSEDDFDAWLISRIIGDESADLPRVSGVSAIPKR